MSHMPKVYLAGPISGLTYDDGQGWRGYVTTRLAERGIEGFSPLRAKGYLRSKGIIEQGYEDTPLSTDHGITTRDRWDVQTADAVLFNLLGASRVSIGTMIEYGWADANRHPIITVIEPKGNVHEHPMLRDVTGFRVSTLEEGIEILDRILNSHNQILGINEDKVYVQGR
jgi:nucleoside 2-deoxyribosyltransferase